MDLQGFKSALDAAKSVLIFLPQNPSQDAVAAALALYLSLSATGKQVTPVASSKPLVRDSHLVGLDKVTDEVGGKNLVITFNLPEDAVDKVTSNTEGGHLNLIISPKKDGNAITSQDLSFGYSGAASDLIITVGVHSLTDIGALYEKEIELFSNSKIVNYGNSTGSFGVINLTDTSSSNAELTTAVLQELHLPITADIAGNLMIGMEDATQGLTSSTMTADTFEAIAVLYRNGARRSVRSNAPQAQVISDMPIVDVEAKENSTPEVKSPAEEGTIQSDWMGPKVMRSSGGGSKK